MLVSAFTLCLNARRSKYAILCNLLMTRPGTLYAGGEDWSRQGPSYDTNRLQNRACPNDLFHSRVNIQVTFAGQCYG